MVDRGARCRAAVVRGRRDALARFARELRRVLSRLKPRLRLGMSHQPLALVDLASRQRIAPTFEWIFANFKFDPNRGTDEAECAAIKIREIALVDFWHFVGLAAVDDDRRWILRAEVGVTQLDAAAADQWWIVLFQRAFKQIG